MNLRPLLPDLWLHHQAHLLFFSNLLLWYSTPPPPPASSWSLESFCQHILFLTFASLHTFKALKNSCNFSLSPALQNTDSIWQDTLSLTPTEIPGLRPLFSAGSGSGGRLPSQSLLTPYHGDSVSFGTQPGRCWQPGGSDALTNVVSHDSSSPTMTVLSEGPF